MPNQPAIPLVRSPQGPRPHVVNTSLPVHEQAARRRRRAAEAPRTGTAHPRPERHPQLPLHPSPAPSPAWVDKPLGSD